MATKKATTATNAQLDALWEAFATSAANLTEAEAEAVDSRLHARESRRTDRAALLILSQSGSQLLEKMHSDAEMVAAYTELALCAHDRAKTLRAAAELMDTCGTRLDVALCDQDNGERDHG